MPKDATALNSLREIDNLKYRIHHGEVIKIQALFGSYTVLNEENNFNFTRFKLDADLQEFLASSLEAKREVQGSLPLINTGTELSEREMKNSVFITSIPWLRLTSIQHPVYKVKSADIPSVPWGKFIPDGTGRLTIPLSVQGHHGFVDAFHIHLFAEVLKKKITTFIKN